MELLGNISVFVFEYRYFKNGHEFREIFKISMFKIVCLPVNMLNNLLMNNFM